MICKHTNKGNDQAIFDVRQNNASIDSQDEVQSLQAERYVSSNDKGYHTISTKIGHTIMEDEQLQ